MTTTYSFGAWVQQRRQQLRLTQREVAHQTYCSTATIKKIETDQRRPSPELATLLAQVLQLSQAQQAIFVDCARGERAVDALANPPQPIPQRTSNATHLPLSATPFIGRTLELADIAGKLADPDCRLLTLVGTGGVGKTRLALAAAQAQQATFADGVFFVPVVAVEETDGLVMAVAKTLNQPLTGADPMAQQLQRLLANKAILLVLDNFEQLVADAAMLADWLANAPKLKLLVTSRERLNLTEEWIYPVAGFSSASASELFNQTARRVNPKLDLAEQTTAITEICRLVDNLPLAVELAAGWSQLMTCTQIAEQIRQDPDFLANGPRNAPERQRSLRALFDHSWRLLAPTEQAVLAGLSVFRGGVAAEEAIGVTEASWPVLLALVNKSLVVAQPNGRYDLHELTRRFAAAKLQETNREAFIRQKHFDIYLTRSAQLDSQLHGPNGIAAYAHLEQEQDNFRAAFKWGLATKQIAAGLRLANQLWFFWLRRGYWREGEQLLTALIAQAGEENSAALCLALPNLATLIALQGRYAEAAPYVPRMIALVPHIQALEPRAAVLTTLAQASQDAQQSFAFFEDALALLQQEETLSWRLAEVHMLYGDRLRSHGRYAEAATQFQQSLQLMRQQGNVDIIAYPLGNLGLLALQAGRLAEAYDLILESVTIARAIGNPLGISDWIYRLGLLLLYQERTRAAISLFAEALTLYEKMNNLRGRACVLACLAEAELDQGSLPSAVPLIGQSLTIYQSLYQQGAQGVRIQPVLSTQVTRSPDELDSLMRVMLVFSAQKRFTTSVTFWAGIQTWMTHSTHKPIPPLQARVDQALASARHQLSETAYATAWATGQSMTPEQGLAFALASVSTSADVRQPKH